MSKKQSRDFFTGFGIFTFAILLVALYIGIALATINHIDMIVKIVIFGLLGIIGILLIILIVDMVTKVGEFVND